MDIDINLSLRLALHPVLEVQRLASKGAVDVRLRDVPEEFLSEDLAHGMANDLFPGLAPRLEIGIVRRAEDVIAVDEHHQVVGGVHDIAVAGNRLHL